MARVAVMVIRFPRGGGGKLAPACIEPSHPPRDAVDILIVP